MNRLVALAVAALAGILVPGPALRAGDCPTCNPAAGAPAPCATCGSTDPFACCVRAGRSPHHWWFPTPGWGHHGRQYLGDCWTARMMGGHVGYIGGPDLPVLPASPFIVGP